MNPSSRTRLRIERMDCPSCVTTIERAVAGVDGVEAASGNAASRILTVDWSGDEATDVPGLLNTIGRSGYVADEIDERHPATEAPSVWRSRMAGIAYGSLGLFVVGLGLRWAGSSTSDTLDLVSRGLLLASALVGAWNFFPKAVGAVRIGRLDMNVLMSVAIVGAISIGELVEAATIAFLFAFAELLESFAVDRARASVSALMKLRPDEASVVRGGSETRVRANEVSVGEIVIVRPGERVPLDGNIVGGQTTVDESALTGEAVPVDKLQGDSVFAGSVNETGVVRVRTTAPASSSTLSRIAELLEEAEATKPEVARFIDRFAAWYTPAVVALAVTVVLIPTALFGAGPFDLWLERGLTLLVIACPCALVISTPVTMVSGLTAAARNGVIIKGARHLEALRESNVIAFDKTGTLTRGHPEVLEVAAVGDHTSDDLLSVAAAVESGSRHPIARAIVDAARARGVFDPGVDTAGHEASVGNAVSGRVGGIVYTVGRPLDPSAIPRDMRQDGASVVEVRSDSSPVGWISLRDQAREDAPSVVARLREAGIERVVMLTGDATDPAERIAAEVGIGEVRAGLFPEEKLEAVRDLASSSRGLVMVGDGVNDAPALAAASVGVAMGAGGSDTALEAADVALIGDDLTKLPYLLALSRKTGRVLTQNIAIAIAVKLALVVAVPLGFVSLIGAVLVGDMGVSLAVTGNALRLGTFQDRMGSGQRGTDRLP